MQPVKSGQFLPTPIDLKKLKAILGPPPLLSTENAQSYDAMLSYYMNALTPRDFFLQMLVKDLVDADWESLRYKRHKAWAVERRDRRWLELQARHTETTERKKASEADQEKPETERDRLWELELETEDLGHKARKAVDGLMKPALDAELSRAMEETIGYYERLDRLEKDSLAKRVIILEQIRLYDEAVCLKLQRYCRELDHWELEQAALEIAQQKNE